MSIHIKKTSTHTVFMSNYVVKMSIRIVFTFISTPLMGICIVMMGNRMIAMG